MKMKTTCFHFLIYLKTNSRTIAGAGQGRGWDGMDLRWDSLHHTAACFLTFKLWKKITFQWWLLHSLQGSEVASSGCVRWLRGAGIRKARGNYSQQMWVEIMPRMGLTHGAEPAQWYYKCKPSSPWSPTWTWMTSALSPFFPTKGKWALSELAFVLWK